MGADGPPQGQISTNLAGVLFAQPETLSDMIQCIYEFILILIVLYILGGLVEYVLYKDDENSIDKRFFAKWFSIVLGNIVAIVSAYFLGEWCLVSPLLLALLASVVWISLKPRHEVIRVKTKALVDKAKLQKK